MSATNTVLAAMVPFSGFLASIFCIIFTSSTYGSKLPFHVRVFGWAIAASFAGMAVQNSINLIVGVPAVLAEAAAPFATLMTVTNICTKLLVVGVVIVTLRIYDKKEYTARGYSPFKQDLSLSPSAIQPARAQAWAPR
jgi:hypothetical protein